MGDVAGHQRLGQLLLINADMGEGAVGVVGHHHDLDETTDLECIVHLADNLAKAVGLGFLPRVSSVVIVLTVFDLVAL